jgi:hypothetical protein
MEPEGSLPHLQQPATRLYPEPAHCRSYQRISPGPMLCRLYGQHCGFYGEQLLAPRPIPKLEDDPFSAVRDFLFSVSAATLHNWKPFLHLQPEGAPRRGERVPLNTEQKQHNNSNNNNNNNNNNNSNNNNNNNNNISLNCKQIFVSNMFRFCEAVCTS